MYEYEKEYLGRYQKHLHIISTYVQKINFYISKSTSIPSSTFIGARVDSSRQLEAPFEKYVQKAYDLKFELEKYKETNKKEMDDILETIAELEDDLQRNILFDHYIEGKSWGELLMKYDYSKSFLIKKFREGLSNIKIK